MSLTKKINKILCTCLVLVVLPMVPAIQGAPSNDQKNNQNNKKNPPPSSSAPSKLAAPANASRPVNQQHEIKRAPAQKEQPQQASPGNPRRMPGPGQGPSAPPRGAPPERVPGLARPPVPKAPSLPSGRSGKGTLPAPDSTRAIQQLNNKRAAGRMGGINTKPLPQGLVTPHHGGAITINASGGRTIDLRRDGTVEKVSLPGGRSAGYDSRGQVGWVHSKGRTTVITPGSQGNRKLVTRQPKGVQLVSLARNVGYRQSPYLTRNGRTYVERTYVVNNQTYTRVYTTYEYQGVTIYRYVPVYYYSPGFYVWVYGPWPGPVYWSWDWYGAPWYVYYAPYFQPYPVYDDASLWLTDYLLAAYLQQAYDEAQANAAAAQGDAGASAAQPPAAESGSAVQLTPEVKQAIADEVKQLLAAEQHAASEDYGQATPSSSQTPPALDPTQATLVVSTDLDVLTGKNDECALTPGDVIQRQGDKFDPNDPEHRVNAIVKSSKKTDCGAGSEVWVSVGDLQEMDNHFHEEIDSGLNVLAENSGRGGLPAAPDTRTSPGQIQVPEPDPGVGDELRKQQQEVDQTERAVQKEAFAQGRS